MKKCNVCGTVLPCVNKYGVCMECDEQFNDCFNKCKNPCRTKEEQKTNFDKWKPDWNKD